MIFNKYLEYLCFAKQNYFLELYTTVSSFGGRQRIGNYNYYFAEGVGFIETDLNNTKIINYTIAP